jgi:hypothetical protein
MFVTVFKRAPPFRCVTIFKEIFYGKELLVPLPMAQAAGTHFYTSYCPYENLCIILCSISILCQQSENLKDESVQNCTFTCCSVWV